MKKSLMVVPTALMAAALTLAGCAEPPAPASSGEPSSSSQGGEGSGGGSLASPGTPEFKACMVSDSGGFDDKSFNQTSYKGLTDAVSELSIRQGQVESQNASDYAKNINAMIDAKCNIVITVGFLLADATVAAAKAHPNVDFAIVDNQPKNAPDNLKPLVFNTAQSAFLGGYLAAGMTKTNKVGTFGGSKIPTVTIYMDGFAQGVAYYNKQKGTDVSVLGWNADKQDGSFVPGDNPFENVQGGKQTAQNLASQGADIIFPVAGTAGEGALQVAKASGGKVNAIWVDTDGCLSAKEYCSSIISSVYKGMDVAVDKVVTSSYHDKFDAGEYVGTLDNDGTGLSPYHQWASKVPQSLQKEITQLRKDIIAGKITITSKSQPS